MSQARLPVIAAIPNYNMADSLSELLPQVADQDYDLIFVLDDASTDHSADVVHDFGNATLVRGSENIGAGGNRNRIIPVLGHDAIIHFIDADMQLEYERGKEVARSIMARPDIGFIGGLVKDPDGQQMAFNYGPRQCLRTDLSAVLQLKVCAIAEQDQERALRLRRRFSSLLEDWPNPSIPPVARQIFWAAEANFLVRASVFKAVGGYDPKLRNHEVQDLAIRMHERGLPRGFNPLLSAVHTAVQVRQTSKGREMTRAEIQIARKHGFRNWIRPDGHFRPEL